MYGVPPMSLNVSWVVTGLLTLDKKLLDAVEEKGAEKGD